MMLILFLKGKKPIFSKRDIIYLSVLGLTGVTFLYIFQFVGIRYTNAPTASVLINTNVIFIAIMSLFILKEKLTILRFLGIIISFIGVIIIILSNFTSEIFSLNNVFFIGTLMVLISAFCWATYSIVGKHMLKKFDELEITSYAFLLGTIFYIPFVASDILPKIQSISIRGWLAVLYLALFCSVFAYMGWYYALKKIEASKAAVYLNFIPLFTIALSIIMGQKLTPLFFLGAILIILGVYITQNN
jgi:drug/metabolite transporter (DMT)-like permease